MAPQFRRLGSSRWLVEFINEWREFGPHLNWRTFHPLMLEIEDDRMMGAVEFTIIILMLGIRVRLTYTDTDFTAELAAHVESIKAGTHPTVKLAPGVTLPPDMPDEVLGKFASMSVEEILRRTHHGDGNSE